MDRADDGRQELQRFPCRPATTRGVERNLERISQASRHLPDTIKDAHAGIPWRQIAQIDNILRHAYRRVEPVLIWEIVEHDLPALRSVIEAAQRELDQDDGA